MSDDLADRISDGHVAVLELVPGEQRFIDLSRFVLRGGASRFAAVVLDDEPVRYVLPIGVPGAKKLDFGVLLIQKTRCAQVWRTDPAKPYHAIVTDLGPETTVAQSPVTVRGEVWGRFDLRHPGAAPMTFLVPPVSSPALPKMLRRVLVQEPQSKQGHVQTTPLAAEITEGVPMVAPSPSVAEPVNPANEHTIIMPAIPADDADDPRPSRPADADADRTQLMAAVDTPEQPLFRDRGRTAPRTPASPTPAESATPVPAPTFTQPTHRPVSEPAREVVAGDPARTPTRRGLSDSAINFITALLITLVVGAILLFARYQGWLPF